MEHSAIATNMRRLLDQYEKMRGQSCRSSSFPEMWSCVVITTADLAQREAFEQQIRDKHQRRELPLDLPIYVVSDPPGPRVGNGGSTLTVVEFLHETFGEALYRQKVLLIHAGGWSQRMPSATILGKAFAAIPHGEPIYQMLDLKLALYVTFVPLISPGIFLVCGDDFLIYDLGEESFDWKIPRSGFTAFCQPSPIAVGPKHGVYVIEGVEDLDRKKSTMLANCLQALQKPPLELIRKKGAAIKSDKGYLDFADGIRIEGEAVYSDNCIYFGTDVMKRMLQLKREIGEIRDEVDAYGDFLQSLGPQATDDYIFNTSNITSVTPELTKVRKQVFDALNGFEFSLLVLNACKFKHIGTTKELIHHFSQDTQFQTELALQKQVFNCWLEESDSDEGDKTRCTKERHESGKMENLEGCVMHSVLVASSTVAPQCVVEYCHFDVPVTVENNSIVSNCQWLRSEVAVSEPLLFPEDTFLHTVSVLHEGTSHFVTVFFNVSDNLKASAPVSGLSDLDFLTGRLGWALKHWGLSEKVVLPRASSGDKCEDLVSLWKLKLYPGAPTMTRSLDVALDMVQAARGDSCLSRELAPGSQVFFSMADVLEQKDVSSMLGFRRQLFDKIRAV